MLDKLCGCGWLGKRGQVSPQGQLPEEATNCGSHEKDQTKNENWKRLRCRATGDAQNGDGKEEQKLSHHPPPTALDKAVTHDGGREFARLRRDRYAHRRAPFLPECQHRRWWRWIFGRRWRRWRNPTEHAGCLNNTKIRRKFSVGEALLDWLWQRFGRFSAGGDFVSRRLHFDVMQDDRGENHAGNAHQFFPKHQPDERQPHRTFDAVADDLAIE